MAEMCYSIIVGLLVALHLGSSSVKADEVLFDTEIREYEMPLACEGKSICFEKGDNYPEDRINELLADMRNLKVHTEAETNTADRKKREMNVDGSGHDIDIDDGPDCPSNTTESPIYYILDNNDKVRVVVQSPNMFLQIFTVRWCLKEGRITWDTPHFSRRLTMRFAIECVTKKMDFDFFVLGDEVDPDTNKPRMEIARAKGGIPVCCRCQYRSDE